MLIRNLLHFEILKQDLHVKTAFKFKTHWGRVLHMRIGNLTTTGSDNGLSPVRCQAIIWINAGLVLIGPLATNFSEILIEMNAFSSKKMHLKMTSAKWWLFCFGLNVLSDVHGFTKKNKKAESLYSCHLTGMVILNVKIRWLIWWHNSAQKIMHAIISCFVVVRHWSIISISFRVTLLTGTWTIIWFLQGQSRNPGGYG